MTEKELKRVQEAIECEGFEYCFCEYSSFNEIDDEDFHKLVDTFVESRQKLWEYLGMDELEGEEYDDEEEED